MNILKQIELIDGAHQNGECEVLNIDKKITLECVYYESLKKGDIYFHKDLLVVRAQSLRCTTYPDIKAAS
jgi:hypothetical protein